MEEADHLIADVRGWGHLQYLPNGADVQDLNGRLIAAAPDLLAALGQTLNAMIHLELSDSSRKEWGAAKAAARAAISKATGGSV